MAEAENYPERIISLVPSLTELLCDLGLENKIIGVTKFCVHPEHIRKAKTIVGGTKNLRMDVIRNLQPDLIIANKEENVKEQIERLAELFPVHVTDVKNFDDAISMINDIGKLTGTVNKAKDIVDKISSERISFLEKNKKQKRKSALYLIWRDPYMSIGNDTFIHAMLDECGLENVCGELLRYPEISAETMKDLQPDIVLLSSEPYPFKEKHVEEIKEILPTAEILLADGEYFSWYGSRMQYAFSYFKKLLYLQ